MDQQGVIRFVNAQTESLFGYDRDELIGKPIDALAPETLWQIYAQHRQNYFADPRTRSSGLDVELSGRHRDGSKFPINVSMSHLDTGDVLLVITGVDDVAAQQRAVRNAGLTEAIVKYSDDAIIGTTLEGTITSWNPAAEKMYGYSSREAIGRSVGLLTPPDRAGEDMAVLAKIGTGRKVQHLETERCQKDGTMVPVSITVAPIRDGDGAIVGASAVHRDVTEQRRAFKIAQRMAAIVESSEDAILAETLEGVITTWNPAAARMFGYSAEEIVGKSARLLVPQDQAGDFKRAFSKVNAGQPIRHLETFSVRKDGTVFPVSLTVSPIRDDGAVVGASVICRDVTRQREAFATVQRLASIVEFSGEAIFGRTLDGIITCWNPAAESMYGYSSEEIVGRPVHLLIPKDRTGEIEASLAKISAGRSVEHLESICVRRDGTAFPVSLIISPIRDDGAVVGASLISRDLTEEKRALTVAQHLAAIVENSEDAVISRSLDGIITCWNPAAERMYGYSSAEIVGKPADILIPAHPTTKSDAVLEQIKAGQHVEHLETRRVRKDGTVFPILLTVSAIRDAAGALIGTSLIHRDVTEHK